MLKKYFGCALDIHLTRTQINSPMSLWIPSHLSAFLWSRARNILIARIKKEKKKFWWSAIWKQNEYFKISSAHYADKSPSNSFCLLDRARLASVNLCTHIASLFWEAVDNICTCTHHIIIKVILIQVFFWNIKNKFNILSEKNSYTCI